jgi:hypothetical protein
MASDKDKKALLWGGLIGLGLLLFGGKKKIPTPPLLEPSIPPQHQAPTTPGVVAIPPGGFVAPGSGLIIFPSGGQFGTATTIGFLGKPTQQPPRKELTSTQFFFYLDAHPSLLKGGLQMSIDSYPTYHALATMLALAMLNLTSSKKNPQFAILEQFFRTTHFFFSAGMLEMITDAIHPLIGQEFKWMKYPKNVAKPVVENYATGQERIYRGSSKLFIRSEALANACKPGVGDFGFLLELAMIRAGQILVLHTISPQKAKEELQKAQGTIGSVAKAVGMAASKVQGAGLLITVVAGLVQGIAALWKAGKTQAKLEQATIQASTALEPALRFFGHGYYDLPSRRMQVLMTGTNSYFNDSQIWRTLLNIEPYVLTRTGVLQIPYFYHKMPYNVPYVFDARLTSCEGIAFVGPYGQKERMCHWTQNPPLKGN